MPDFHRNYANIPIYYVKLIYCDLKPT